MKLSEALQQKAKKKLKPKAKSILGKEDNFEKAMSSARTSQRAKAKQMVKQQPATSKGGIATGGKHGVMSFGTKNISNQMRLRSVLAKKRGLSSALVKEGLISKIRNKKTSGETRAQTYLDSIAQKKIDLKRRIKKLAKKSLRKSAQK